MTTKVKLYKMADGRLLTKKEIEVEIERLKDIPEYHIAKAFWEEIFEHPRKYRNALATTEEVQTAAMEG